MTAIREALQALEQHPDATVRNTASFVIAALSQEVPQESVPAGYVLVDLNEYDGDDPRADADTDRWMAAADAFVKANPHNMRGLAEWECQMRAAINVLATPQVKVAAQEPPPRDPQQEVDLLLGRAAAPSGELPPLPEPIAKVCEGRFNRTRWISSAPLNIQDLPVGPLFTADQMRAYGKAARGEK